MCECCNPCQAKNLPERGMQVIMSGSVKSIVRVKDKLTNHANMQTSLMRKFYIDSDKTYSRRVA